MSTAFVDPLALAEAAERYAKFRAGRERTVRSATGALALEATLWVLEPGSRFDQVPGAWSPLPGGIQGVLLSASTADGITVDGALVDGTVPIAGRDSPHPSVVSLADGRTLTVIANGTELSALRVWNAASEAIGRFDHIDAYEYDASLVVEAEVRLLDGHSLDILHVRDGDTARSEPIGAEFAFELHGEPMRFAGITEGDAFLITFSDATTGRDTYGVGRFLMLSPRSSGTVTIDFNRAYLPPCAFSTGFNCPIPPAQNRLPLEVRAGEKNALDVIGGVFVQGGVFA